MVSTLTARILRTMAPYFLDEAATAPLLSNAKKIASALVGQNSRDKIFGTGQSERYTLPATCEESISLAFRKIVGRGPSGGNREVQTFTPSTKTGGHVTAGKALLTAVLLQPAAYRSSWAMDPDEFGRIRLSSREIAYALSYSLDNQPIREFLDASAQADLATNKHVAELVAKRLKDDSLLQDKNPRIIQFFREYFNYPFAKEVFKDQPEEASMMRVPESPTQTRYATIRNDEEVLHSLLTSRNYYVNAEYKRVRTTRFRLPGTSQSWPTNQLQPSA